ncbi:MAG: UDP-2,4-diacetamido-2,4,6-trideoxy-beta-L-altropyranose hydrolase [Butyrivibrio sp.]|uniref:UDP-2,4-diacetamido-2,4, 6-trideoxy-beta-L-altropyranose hydrolase n=1 Tax=Butyrivibrio sp. TaxID=28121 RepID=UPI001B1C6513|nr:UDP-2,4-diacetamido-2,4,6-trideoxy-beta-L-altropyranose hydrolase [Butyrivibrio sp.]MBO6241609.1 UDP-2,4-diacetamido-2,4,6-trideoxy-beta-L-altropyranose hydrolase [Butyrivibrio sp.]
MGSKKIWIKTNANESIAIGHMRRCMTIAKELADLGASVKFILSDNESERVLKDMSEKDGVFYTSKVLNTTYSEPLGDLNVLDEMFANEKPDFYLMDSYYLEREYFDGINGLINKHRLSTKTGYIDDLYKFDYPVDFILNYDLEIPENFYSAKKQLLGVKYAPLRSQFAKCDYETREHAKVAFLSSGGTDPYHVIGKILQEIYSEESPCRKVLAFNDFRCLVIVGALFEEDYKRELREFAKVNPSVTLFEGVSDMADIMKQADLAISAGGTTLYELCAVGVPTVVYSMADNQMEFVKAFDKAGAVRYAGDARDNHRLAQKIVTWGTAAVDSKGFRKRMSESARSLIDGKGALRIAKAIMELA